MHYTLHKTVATRLSGQLFTPDGKIPWILPIQLPQFYPEMTLCKSPGVGRVCHEANGQAIYDPIVYHRLMTSEPISLEKGDIVEVVFQAELTHFGANCPPGIIDLGRLVRRTPSMDDIMGEAVDVVPATAQTLTDHGINHHTVFFHQGIERFDIDAPSSPQYYHAVIWCYDQSGQSRQDKMTVWDVSNQLIVKHFHLA